MRRVHRSCPVWFQLTLAVGAALVWRVATNDASPAATPAPAAPVSLAFFGFIIAIGELIWNFFQASADVIVAGLVAAVHAIWFVLNLTVNGLAVAARAILSGFKAAWGFLRTVYDDVLKPAWRKFWVLVDYARTQLERVFKPILKYLLALRDQLLKFYAKWIRPVLDTIDVARRILAVFTALGFQWAKTLDRQLLALENRIRAPFLKVLARLNEVINDVNRVMTADGLFQRLALVRSIERDIGYIARIFWAKQVKGTDAADAAQLASAKYDLRDPRELASDVAQYYETQDGPLAPIVDELVPLWRIAADQE